MAVDTIYPRRLPLVATVGYGVRTVVRTYDPFRVFDMLGGGKRVWRVAHGIRPAIG